MYVEVKNENYGFSVATQGNYVGVGNPRIVRYNSATASLVQTGSFDVFRYDRNTDTHLYVETVVKPFDPTEAILLAAESASIKSSSLHTELYGYDYVNRDKDIEVDEGTYIQNLDNDYGHTLDCYNDQFAVGCRYYWDQVQFSSSIFDSSGSCVDIWDYRYSTKNQYTNNSPCSVVGYGFTGSGTPPVKVGDYTNLDLGGLDLTTVGVFFEKVYVPPGYGQVWVSNLSAPDLILSKYPVSPDGQFITFAYDWTLPALVPIYKGIIVKEPVRFHIPNPDTVYSESFGQSVSLNQDWLAVGSPKVSGSKGMVYLFHNQSTGSQLSWSLYQRLEASTGSSHNLYGWSVSLNKSTSNGNCSNRLVVGSGAPNNNTVYLYELSASSWVESHQFHQDTSKLYPLQFDTGSYPILLPASYQTSSFGWDVGIWEDTVVIGAPTERNIYEYTGSSEYQQGTAYIFERCSGISCPSTSSTYNLDQKIYGDKNTMKNNRLGYSVSVYDNNMLIGVPKVDVIINPYASTGSSPTVDTSCYLQSSIPQQNYCNSDLEDTLNGQWIYMARNTSSMHWELEKVFQKKKKFMSPYRSFGFDLAVGDQSIVVGAPMLISNLHRKFDLVYTASLGINLDDVMGKAYIYNLLNYKETFHVGNVFYKNGTIVVNTSGSAFEGLYFNPTTPYTYEYLLNYKSRHSIYEKQVVCSVNPGEFNVSTNPSAVTFPTSVFDINGNGEFDFQDADVLLRYMQYKNSTTLGGYSFDWSSSVLKSDDEVSYYNYNSTLWDGTDTLFTSSLKQFELVDVDYADLLDFNQDNKIDINDINIFWKYSARRLTEKNYRSYINTNCQRQQVSDVMMYLDNLSKRNTPPMINDAFFDYNTLSLEDPTGSFLAPMVTTIGLYDDLDLVAVAKLGSPIKLPNTLPINFVIKMDF